MLTNRRIFVAEDEYFLATALAEALTAEGAIVLGPEPTVQRALACIQGVAQAIDAAVLDVDLARESSFPIAEWLTARNIPFMFLTGYDVRAVQSLFPHVLTLGKPYNMRLLLQALERLVQ